MQLGRTFEQKRALLATLCNSLYNDTMYIHSVDMRTGKGVLWCNIYLSNGDAYKRPYYIAFDNSPEGALKAAGGTQILLERILHKVHSYLSPRDTSTRRIQIEVMGRLYKITLPIPVAIATQAPRTYTGESLCEAAAACYVALHPLPVPLPHSENLVPLGTTNCIAEEGGEE